MVGFAMMCFGIAWTVGGMFMIEENITNNRHPIDKTMRVLAGLTMFSLGLLTIIYGVIGHV
jgi:uncharacterized membrane protein HdeD (DUF308 family)